MNNLFQLFDYFYLKALKATKKWISFLVTSKNVAQNQLKQVLL